MKLVPLASSTVVSSLLVQGLLAIPGLHSQVVAAEAELVGEPGDCDCTDAESGEQSARHLTGSSSASLYILASLHGYLLTPHAGRSVAVPAVSGGILVTPEAKVSNRYGGYVTGLWPAGGHESCPAAPGLGAPSVSPA